MAPTGKRQRLRRCAIASAAILIALVLSPFVFTTAFVRWFLKRDNLAPYRITVSSATLLPRGELILYDLRVHDPVNSALPPVVLADSLQIGFSWRRIFSGQFDSIDGQGVELKASAASLQNLAAGGTADTSAPPQIKRIGLNGRLHLDELTGSGKLPVPEVPFRLLVTAETSGSVPAYDVYAVAGSSEVVTDDNAPALAIRANARYLGGPGWSIDISSAAVHNLVLTVPPEHLAWVPTTFGDTSAGAQLRISGFNAKGMMTLDTAPHFIGDITLQRADVRLVGQTTDSIERLKLTAACSLVLSQDLVSSSTVTGANVSIRAVRLGGLEIANAAGTSELRSGELRVRDFHGNLAEGTFDLSLTLDQATGLREAYLKLEKVEQSQIARNFATERLSAQGLIDANAVLRRDELGRLTGTLAIETAGPGRLSITDEKFTNALAAKVPVPAGVTIPPNMQEIIVGQLRDYPYTVGFVQVADKPGGVEVVLDYTRRPLELGDPGHGVMIELEGQSVRANYPVHLRSFTIVLPDRTVADLVETGAGLRSQAASAATRRK